ncbi:MAG: peptidase M23 [Paracoccus sp.]|uniref:LysM peptidoglycan-binding domain-containing protein n=1 Tax=Paracoccus sp. TaxID=267 RepID=UPI000C65F0B7|nr:LysM peptidoglycan-binding domain-containing protein [Paracoccus sp. (in: a-proteobacteria)]MBA49886.1 peptidase M23 [Paracoccus sp. (in: a-proteobacteria)]
MSRTYRLIGGASAAVLLLASCGANGFDPDLRRMMPGALSTAEAAATAAPRPQPDSRGLISFPDYQIAIASSGDTPATIAARLGLGADELARYNALPVNASLQQGQTLVLPRRVADATGAAAPAARSGGAPPADAASDSPASTASSVGGQPRQHVVAAGETAWSISRRYGVSVQDLARWNGLPSDMSVRLGQRLIVPIPGQRAPDPAAITTAPGSGSPTPRPPSAADPLPREDTAPASKPAPAPDGPDLGSTRTAASGGGRFSMPVPGAIISVYEKGKNEGIDIAAPAGTPIKAAGAGVVAAITQDTSSTPILVIRHDGGLMTVYTGFGSLDVAKGASVGKGQTLGKAGKGGVVHFEVRRGFESADPEDYLG